MQAIVAHQYGPADSFCIEERAQPEPQAGEVRIRVAAAGISFVDLLTAAGQYQIKPPLPFTPGSEIAGTVDAVGAGVTGVQPGDKVSAVAPLGAWAEQVCVPARYALPIPPGVSFAEAAVFQVPYSTVLMGLTLRGHLRAGESLFIPGAAGSIGLAAVQVGKLLGARVIAGASTEKKRAACLTAGADEVVDTTGTDWPKSLKGLTSGRGVDVVLDPVGGPSAEAVFRSLARCGRYLVVGFASGGIPSIGANWALLKEASLIGVNVGPFEINEPEAAQRLREQLAAWQKEGKLTPLIAASFPWQDFVAAAKLASERDTVGRVLLTLD